MQAPVEGFDEEKSMLLGHDAKGSTTMYDAIRKAIFKGAEEPTP